MDDIKRTNKEMAEEIARLKNQLEELKAINSACADEHRELMEYRDLLQMIPEIVFRIDPEGRFTFINNSVKNLGYDPDDLLGRHFSQIVHPDDFESVSRKHVLPRYLGKNFPPEECPKLFDERRTGDRKTMGLEIRLVKKTDENEEIAEAPSEEGSPFAEISASGRYDKDVVQNDKNFLGSVGIIRNIREIRQKNPSGDIPDFNCIVSVIPDIIYRLDPDGNFTYVNEAVKNLGYDPEELLGQHFSVILPEDVAENVSRNKVLPRLKGIRTGDEKAPKLFDERRTGARRTKALEVPIISKEQKDIPVGIDGLRDSRSIIGEITASGYYNSDISAKSASFLGTVGIIRDVTSRKKAENELLKKNRELDDFAYIVSHELKSPLKIIQGFIALIKENPALLEKYIDRIHLQSDKMIHMVDSLLKLSRAGRMIENVRMINLEPVIKKSFTCSKPEQIPCHLEIIPPLPRVKADVHRMEEVFFNLIENSIKYRDPGKDMLNVKVDHYQTPCETVITFSDNGSGVSRNFLKKIFNPGFVLDRDKGTGFGLSIISKIMEAHGGRIWAESEGENMGTTFFLLFPR